jgi:hypothetical protein
MPGKNEGLIHEFSRHRLGQNFRVEWRSMVIRSSSNMVAPPELPHSQSYRQPIAGTYSTRLYAKLATWCARLPVHALL